MLAGGVLALLIASLLCGGGAAGAEGLAPGEAERFCAAGLEAPADSERCGLLLAACQLVRPGAPDSRRVADRLRASYRARNVNTSLAARAVKRAEQRWLYPQLAQLPKQRPSGKPVLAVLCPLEPQTHPSAAGRWGPRSGGTGISGAEEAVLHLAQALARRGEFHVEVYANPPAEQVGLDIAGVMWLPYHQFDPDDSELAVFIAHRSCEHLIATAAQRSVLWLHDIAPECFRQKELFDDPRLEVWALSRYHAGFLPAWLQPKVRLVSNGYVGLLKELPARRPASNAPPWLLPGCQ